LIPAVEDTRKFPVFPKKISPIIPLGGLWDKSTSSEEKKFAPGWQPVNRASRRGDLEGLVVKRKDGKYTQQTLWYKILNPIYTQKSGRQEFFQRQ
jgi:hypothetical protein